MLRLTGKLNINGETKEYKGEFVSPIDLANSDLGKRAGIPLLRTEYDGFVTLELMPDRITYRGGERRVPSSMLRSTEFSGNFEGETYTLRYYKSASPHPTNPAVMMYEPSNVGFMRAERVGLDYRNFDLLVFMMLHPSSANSPFGHPIEGPVWRIQDLKKEGALMIARLQQVSGITREVMEVDEPTLNIMVYGLRDAGLPVDMEFQAYGDAMRSHLIMLLNTQQFTQNFIKAWQSAGTKFSGLVRLAVQHGVAVLKADGSRQFWAWNFGTRRDQMISYVTPESDPVVQLQSILSSQSFYSDALVFISQSIAAIKNGAGQTSPSIAIPQEIEAAAVEAAMRMISDPNYQQPSARVLVDATHFVSEPIPDAPEDTPSPVPAEAPKQAPPAAESQNDEAKLPPLEEVSVVQNELPL